MAEIFECVTCSDEFDISKGKVCKICQTGIICKKCSKGGYVINLFGCSSSISNICHECNLIGCRNCIRSCTHCANEGNLYSVCCKCSTLKQVEECRYHDSETCENHKNKGCIICQSMTFYKI